MAHEIDMSLKFVARRFLKILIRLLKIKGDLDFSKVEILTEEQINVEPSIRRPDLIVKIGDRVIMIEFQSTKVYGEEMRRFGAYLFNFDEQVNKGKSEISFFVLSTAEKTQIKEYEVSDGNVLKIPIISLWNLNVGVCQFVCW